jgi:SAM-dependent methyltransferase
VIEQTYKRYTLHSIGEHQETKVLFDQYEDGITKSHYNCKKIIDLNILKPKGKLLDIGCHYGSFLQSFHHYFPHWELKGIDVSDRFKQTVESISDNCSFSTKKVEDLDGTFDVIVITHVLEHIDNIPQFINTIRNKISADGLIYLQVNNLENNVFLPVIYEQFYNFTVQGLSDLLAKLGVQINYIDLNTIPKEMTLVCQKCPIGSSNSVPMNDLNIEKNIKLIKFIEQNLREYARLYTPIYILGTTYVAKWMAANFSLNIVAFLDEDITAHDDELNGVKVISPHLADTQHPVLLPFPLGQSKHLQTKLKNKFNLNGVIPPFNSETNLC